MTRMYNIITDVINNLREICDKRQGFDPDFGLVSGFLHVTGLTEEGRYVDCVFMFIIC